MGKKKKPFDPTNVLKRLGRINDRMDDELRRLAKRPDLYKFAVQVTDSVVDSLIVLRNYKQCVGNNGTKTDISDVMDDVKRSVHATFKRLTGREYEPEIVRQMKFLKA